MQSPIYQRTLKQLNAVFPTLNLKPPAKKATVRPLIQQIQCPTLTTPDLTTNLHNPQTAPKSLTKLSRIVSIWLQVLEQNERARQQQIAKPVDWGAVRECEGLGRQAAGIGGQEEFVLFVREMGEGVGGLGGLGGRMSGVKDYKEVYICKQPEFYTTIPQIPQQQYLQQLEQTTQHLSILQQLITKTLQNPSHLSEFQTMIQSDQLFRRKDNAFNRLLNYSLNKAIQLGESLERVRAVVGGFVGELGWAVVRAYYLVFLCGEEIQRAWEGGDWRGLGEIRGFLTGRPEVIFVKLYDQYVTQHLIRLQSIDHEIKTALYTANRNLQTELAPLQQKITKINHQLTNPPPNSPPNLEQPQFLQLFQQIQQIFLSLEALPRTKKQSELELIRNAKEMLRGCEERVVELFVSGGGMVGGGGKSVGAGKSVGGGGSGGQSRRVLSVENSRLSQKSRMMSDNKSIKNQSRHSAITNPKTPQPPTDRGQDIFPHPPTQSPNPQKHHSLLTIPQLYESECEQYIRSIQPSFGQLLEDATNFRELAMLVEIGQVSPGGGRDKEVLKLVMGNLVRLEIVGGRIGGIFLPGLRVNVLKMLYEKVIEMDYKTTKFIENGQFESLPQNIKEFTYKRSKFLKNVNKHLDKILSIALTISKLNKNKQYKVNAYSTYETFLKILIAQKQLKAYQLSLKDQKQSTISPQTKKFLTQSLYTPFIQYLNNFLPVPTAKLPVLLDQIQFFVQYSEKLGNFLQSTLEELELEQGRSQRDREENLRGVVRELGRRVGAWVGDYRERIGGLGEGKGQGQGREILDYGEVQAQLSRMEQILKVCGYDNRKSIKSLRNQLQDPTALHLLTILQTKH